MEESQAADQLRLGLIGLGWWGGVLAEAVRAASGVRLDACFARTRTSREQFAAEHGCEAASTLEDLLERDVDGVLISTPHSTHRPLIEAVAEAGKHVYVEKPMTLTVEEGRRCLEAADRAGVTLQVGHQRRRQPATRRIREMIDADELGAVLQMTGQMSAPGQHLDFSRWRYDPAESPAGGMTGLGVHLIDSFHYLVGPVRRVFALSEQIVGEWPLDDATVVVIEHESGTLSQLATCYRSPRADYLTVYGERAVAWNLLDGRRLWVHRIGAEEPSEVNLPSFDPVRDEVEEFARCIRTEAPPETGGAEGLEAVAVLEAIVLSAEEGEPVELARIRGDA